MNTSSGTICAYCAEAVLDGSQRPEHPLQALQAALGSSLQVFTVCDPCNDWADREVDQPFLNDLFVLEMRSAVRIRDHRRGTRGRVPPSPLLRGHTAEGEFFFIDDAGVLRQGKPHVRDLGDGRYQISAGTEVEARRALEEFTRRAQRDGHTVSVVDTGSRRFRFEVTNKVSVHKHAWIKAAAKVALGVASRVYPEDWRLGTDAAKLREWLHGQDSANLTNDAPMLMPSRERPRLVELLTNHDEHLVFFNRGNTAVDLCVSLFGGRASYRLPVDTTPGARAPEEAWLLDPRRPRAAGETTWTALLDEAVTRSAA